MSSKNLFSRQKSSTWFWLIIITLIALIIFGIFKISRQGSRNTNDPFEVASNDNVKGNKNATTTLIEYSDFQCPACARYFPVIKKLNEEFPDDLKIVYRHFPLTSIHPYALTASKASESAGLQGRFWEMHDLIFQNQALWTQDSNPQKTFESYAELLKLDMNKYKQDFNGKVVLRKINDDRQLSIDLKLQGTPTFFLNGTQIKNINNYDELKQLVSNEINKSKNLPITEIKTEEINSPNTKDETPELKEEENTTTPTATNNETKDKLEENTKENLEKK